MVMASSGALMTPLWKQRHQEQLEETDVPPWALSVKGQGMNTCYLVQDPVIKNTITKQLLPMFLAWLYLEADILAVKSPLE